MEWFGGGEQPSEEPRSENRQARVAKPRARPRSVKLLMLGQRSGLAKMRIEIRKCCDWLRRAASVKNSASRSTSATKASRFLSPCPLSHEHGRLPPSPWRAVPPSATALLRTSRTQRAGTAVVSRTPRSAFTMRKCRPARPPPASRERTPRAEIPRQRAPRDIRELRTRARASC